MSGAFWSHRVGQTGVSSWLVAQSDLEGDVELTAFPSFRIHYKSEENLGVYMCQLWKTESRYREFLFLYSFRTPPPNFLGALSAGEPQAHSALDLENRDVLLPVVRLARVFGRLIAALAIAYTRCWLDTRLCGEMGG